ncbi:MAG: macro domain-containing protein [Succinivibrio sp.]
MLDRETTVQELIRILMTYLPGLVSQANDFSKDYFAQRSLLRGLMNMHSQKNQLPERFFKLQDELLQYELSQKSIIKADSLESVPSNSKISIYEGDLTALDTDVLVNVAAPNLLGCMQAGHNCVDNCIHSSAGLQLRFECASIMQDNIAPAGVTILTGAYNLPCRAVIHAVAPIITFEPKDSDLEAMRKCYKGVLDLCVSGGYKTVAIPTLVTGRFGTAVTKLVKTAVDVVTAYLAESENDLKVIFCPLKEQEKNTYVNLLTPHEETGRELHPFFNINLF